MNKLKHCSDCSLEEANQLCEACPNYEAQRRHQMIEKVVMLREQWYNDGFPQEELEE